MAAEKIDALELGIEAKLSVDNLDKLIASMKKLGKEVDNVKNKKPKSALKDVGDGANEAANGVEKFLSKSVKFAAVIALLNKVSGVISDSVSKALTYNKTLNMFTVSLGQYATNATKYGETVRDALGIDIAGWQNAQGIFQTLITGFGVGGDQAAYMSQNLTQLSYDIASFYNLTNEEAANKIKSAISGRLEPIRKLGYDLSQSKLVDIAKNPKYYGQQTFAINEQTGAIEANTTAVDDNTRHKIVNFNQLTQQEKVQLRYIALMTQVTQVQGNYAKTLNDPVNQLKVFKEQLNMTSRELGNVFIPALNQVLPYLTAFAQLAGEAFRAIAKFFGYEIPDMSDRMDISPVAEPYNDVVEATGKAAKNAKKLRDYTIGLDELNVLKKPDDTAGGGGGRVGENSNLSNLLTPGYDFLSKAVKSSIEQAKKDIQSFFNDLKKRPISLPLEILFNGATELGENFWTALLGKTPEQLGVEAATQGNTIGEQFCIQFYRKFEENSETLMEAIFGSPEDLASRAKKAGNEVGVQFAAEVGKAIAEFINSNPVFKELYKIGTGKDIEKELEAFTRAANGQKTAHSSGGGSRSGGVRVGSQYPDSVIPQKVAKESLGNTAADEARKLGEAHAKAYAEGLAKGVGHVHTAGANLRISGVNGANADGKGGQQFYNTSANEAYKYAMGLTSSKAKSEAYVGGYTLSNQGIKGSSALANDSKTGFNYAGQMSGKGYVAGIEKYKPKASSSGRIIAEAALNTLKKVLGIHSPSTAYGEQAYWSVMGYAKNMEKYSYLAENAAKDMANASIDAVKTADSYFTGNVSGIGTTTNAGYGIGMANTNSMATLAGNIYNAVVSGMSVVAEQFGGETKVIIGGKEVYRVVQKEKRNSGIAIGNGAFT